MEQKDLPLLFIFNWILFCFFAAFRADGIALQHCMHQKYRHLVSV